MNSRRERVRAFDAAHPLLWDITLSVLVLLACANASGGLRPVGGPFLVIVCGAVAFRRRAPLAALAVATGAVIAGVAMSRLLEEDPPWGYLAIWILLFNLGLRRPQALAAAAALAGAVVVAAGFGAADPAGLSLEERSAELLPIAAMSVAAFLAGSQLRVAREAQQRQREEAARAAVAAERSRISRELHDLIGHDLSVIASLSAGGQSMVRSSPEDAERALAAIGQVSRASVSQMRHVLRLLRSTDDESLLPLSPQPDLAQLDALIDAVRGAGFRVDDERHGDLRGMPPGHQLAVYRIVQEALTNAMRHGGEGTAVTVRIVAGAHDVVVSIADRSAVVRAERHTLPTDGHGILGMRERVDALGGTLEAGPTADGWRVRATIPKEGGVSDEGAPRR